MIARFYKLDADLAARRDVTASAKLVLAAIADRIGRNGMAWPGQRRLAKDTGLSRPTIQGDIRRLVEAGLLAVEKRRNGQSDRYRLIEQSGQETCPVKAIEPQTKPAKKLGQGGQETCPLPAKKLGHNQTDSLTRQEGAAKPPDTSTTEAAFALTTPKATEKKSGAGTLTTAWIARQQDRTGRPFPSSARGRLAGTIKRLLADFPETDLSAAIDRWFAIDRRDFGIGLFVSKLQGGDAELTGRAVGEVNDPLSLANGLTLAAMEISQ